MAYSGNTTSQPLDVPPLHRLSPTLLLWIYAVIPAVLWFLLVDYLFTDMRMARGMQVTDQFVLVIGALLQAPHNFASLLTFLDREYLREYGRKLLACAVVGVLSLSIPWFLGEVVFAFFLLTYTFYHQSAQQAGIAALIAQNKSRLHEAWRWMSLTILVVGLVALAVKNNPEAVFTPAFEQLVLGLSGLFLGTFVLISVLVARRSKTRIGMAYIGATSLMMLVYIGLYVVNLPVLMLFIPVFVHDITAFAFYINHNANRNRVVKHNWVSRIRNVVPMPEILLTPLAGLLCGAVFLLGLDTSFYIYLATLLNVMHFYIEGIMWKGGSLHRKYIQV
jgi:hypothetical protein